jgi:hypothetical protein
MNIEGKNEGRDQNFVTYLLEEKSEINNPSYFKTPITLIFVGFFVIHIFGYRDDDMIMT